MFFQQSREQTHFVDKIEFLNIKSFCAFSYHCALKGYTQNSRNLLWSCFVRQNKYSVAHETEP
jgi:hypothetical protein